MLLDIFLTLISYTLFFIYAAVAALPVLALIFIPSSWPLAKTAYFCMSKFTAKVLLWITFLPVTYQGLERLPDPSVPTIFIANHQSSLDIFLVASVLGSRPYNWIAIERLFHYPLLGRLLHYSAIPVYERNDSNSDKKSVVKSAVERLSEGYSIMLFPEGGRYHDDTIHPFFSGFAAMAKLSGAQVVPLFISGAGNAMPPFGRIIRRVPLMITVGESFVCGADESVDAFRKRVYDWYTELNWRRDLLEKDYGIRIAKYSLEKNNKA